MKKLIVALLAILIAAPGLRAAEFNSVKTEGEYVDVAAYVENAIINKGLTIDFSGEIHQMLERTGADVGSTKPVYAGAKFFQFCSAKLSRQMMEADPATMGLCPFSVFVYETMAEPGVVHVGYRRPGAGSNEAASNALKEIDQLLESIIREAIE